LKSEHGEISYHLIEIIDNEIGFDTGHADRIFNVFTRLHGNAEYKGTGVGLSIVRKATENHNGYVWLKVNWMKVLDLNYFYPLPLHKINI
jgi:light-regulated signal transduction histidine kinase (bacteriophytochrome)